MWDSCITGQLLSLPVLNAGDTAPNPVTYESTLPGAGGRPQLRILSPAQPPSLLSHSTPPCPPRQSPWPPFFSSVLPTSGSPQGLGTCHPICFTPSSSQSSHDEPPPPALSQCLLNGRLACSFRTASEITHSCHHPIPRRESPRPRNGPNGWVLTKVTGGPSQGQPLVG